MGRSRDPAAPLTNFSVTILVCWRRHETNGARDGAFDGRRPLDGGGELPATTAASCSPDSETPGQPVLPLGWRYLRAEHVDRRQHAGVRHRQGRGAGRHDAGGRRKTDSRPGQVGDRQAGDDHHQHAYALRPHRQQYRVSGDRRVRRAREHAGRTWRSRPVRR